MPAQRRTEEEIRNDEFEAYWVAYMKETCKEEERHGDDPERGGTE